MVIHLNDKQAAHLLSVLRYAYKNYINTKGEFIDETTEIAILDLITTLEDQL